jgi:bifunctional DNase/RNase
MIEMSVRAVKRAGEDRLVAVLERGSGESEPPGQRPGRLLITVSRPEAHVLFHELRAERTLPGQTFELMAQIVAQLNGRLTAVELVADENGRPSARLRLERPDGRSTIPTRAGQALALAVHLRVPLLVAEALLTGQKAQAGKGPIDRLQSASETEADGADARTAPKAGAAVPETDTVADVPNVVEVPEIFLRAFDE